MMPDSHNVTGPRPMPLREGPRHTAAMLRRPRCGRRATLDAAPALKPRFTDWALI